MSYLESLTVVRHGQSAYNELREKKKVDPIYVRFLDVYSKRKSDPITATEVAHQLVDHLKASVYDNFETPLTDEGKKQALETGIKMRGSGVLPDVVFVSPHIRAAETLDFMSRGWPELKNVGVVEEERIREQERGLYLNFNDWKIFTVFYPEQEELMATQGHYWYRYPQGENIPDVNLRVGSWLSRLKEIPLRNILAITHHIPILSVRANLENISWKNLMEIDNKDTPVNCGVTSYLKRSDLSELDVLTLDTYNQRFYQ